MAAKPAPDFPDEDAGMSSAAARTLCRRKRKTTRTKITSERIGTPDERIPADRANANASLAKHTAVFVGPQKATAVAKAAAVLQAYVDTAPATTSARSGADSLLSIRESKLRSDAQYAHSTDSTSTSTRLMKALYANIHKTRLCYAGREITDAKEAKDIIDAGRFEVPEYTTSHIKLLSRQHGDWTLIKKAGLLTYPPCSSTVCVVTKNVFQIPGLHENAERPIILLHPSEIGDSMAVKRAAKESRCCFWCACHHFGIFLAHYRDLSPGQVPLPDTRVTQVFRVKCDAEDGFQGRYLLPYANGSCGGGICDGVPRFDVSAMSVEYTGERWVMNFDPMCFTVQVPGTGGTAHQTNSKLAATARSAYNGIISKIAPPEEIEPQAKRRKISTPIAAAAAAAAASAVDEEDPLSQWIAPLATAASVAATGDDDIFKLVSPPPPPHGGKEKEEDDIFKLVAPFHNANSHVNNNTVVGKDVASALTKYRPILAPICREQKREPRSAAAAAASASASATTAGGGGKRESKRSGEQRLSSEPMASCMNASLLRSRSECRRRVAGLFASLAALVNHTYTVKRYMATFRVMFDNGDAERLLERISERYHFNTDCPRWSENANVHVPASDFSTRDDLVHELYTACTDVNMKPLARVEFVKMLHALPARVKVNVYRFAILLKWHRLLSIQGEQETKKTTQKLLATCEYYTLVNVDVYWYMCYSLLSRMKLPMSYDAFCRHGEREDVIDPLYDSRDVVDEITLPVITEFLERAFLDSNAQTKRVPLTHILDKCMPHRSGWRMGENVTIDYMKGEPYFRTYVLRVILCALLGNYSDIPLGTRVEFRTRCFLYHSYHRIFEGDAGMVDPWTTLADEERTSKSPFYSIVGGINRFCFHALHRHIFFVARTNPSVGWCLRALFGFDELMSGADSVLHIAREGMDELVPKFFELFETSSSDSFENEEQALTKALQQLSKRTGQESKSVMEVVPFPKKLNGFVTTMQSYVMHFPIISATVRDAIRRERLRHLSVPCTKDGRVCLYRFSIKPIQPSDTQGERDELDNDKEEEDLRAMTDAAPELGDDMDADGTGGAEKEEDGDASASDQVIGTFKSISEFCLPKQLVVLIETWVAKCCDTRHKFPDHYIFQLFEMAGLDRDETCWLRTLSFQFQLETKIKDDVRRFAIRFPYAYAVMQTFCVFYRRKLVLQTIPLPAHYHDAQVAAVKSRFKLDAEDVIPESACNIFYCTVCMRIFNIVREHMGPNHVFGKDGGYNNVTMGLDWSNPTQITFRCNGRDMFAGRSCMTEPLAKISLVGNALVYRNELITLCPQPGCGCPSVIDGVRSVRTEYGPACSDCSLCLAAASMELQATGHMPITSTECAAARHLVSLEKRRRAAVLAGATSSAAEKKKRPAAATAATASSTHTFSAIELKTLCETFSRTRVKTDEAAILMARANVGGALTCQVCDATSGTVRVVTILNKYPIRICHKHKPYPLLPVIRNTSLSLQRKLVRTCAANTPCTCNGFSDTGAGQFTCDGELNVATIAAVMKHYGEPGTLAHAFHYAQIFRGRRHPRGSQRNNKRIAAAAASKTTTTKS